MCSQHIQSSGFAWHHPKSPNLSPANSFTVLGPETSAGTARARPRLPAIPLAPPRTRWVLRCDIANCVLVLIICSAEFTVVLVHQVFRKGRQKQAKTLRSSQLAYSLLPAIKINTCAGARILQENISTGVSRYWRGGADIPVDFA